MSELKQEFQRMAMALSIPKEMFWAYEIIRQSGHWNMLCIDPMLGRYQTGSDPTEMMQVMDDIYIKYCVYTEVDLDDPKNQEIYKHVTKDHIRLIQYCYSELRDAYGMPPEGIVNLKREVKTTITF